MIVGCKLPHGHTIEFNGETIVLNGANVGFDGDSPWKMDAFPDSPLRTSGVGLTELQGKQADAFKAWYEAHKTGGPIAAGTIFYADTQAAAQKEAKGREKVKTGTDALDPSKDLPKGLETAKDE